ncbi:hypothetical protein DL96DRAFT_1600202 [Flagelloscypha sp. PMI_526]|nr:hypothetical protein DL96DRAFT_1600202 [Flagelloscypha sp. PMI_526]
MKGKTSVLERSWSTLPSPLLNYILTLALCSTRDSLPKSWTALGDAWAGGIVYKAIRDAGEVDGMVNTCGSWLRALSHHPVWARLLSLIDPTSAGQSTYLAHHHKNSSSSVPRPTPYSLYRSILENSCLICRINFPHSHMGVLNGKLPDYTKNPRGGVIHSATYGGIFDGIIPICKHHRLDETYCSVCLHNSRSTSSQQYSPHGLALSASDEHFGFPNASYTCKFCRTSYLTMLAARHGVLEMVGGAGFLHQPALDWEARSAIDAYVDLAEGTAEGVLRVCKEKWWLRKQTKIAEYVRLAVRSERLQYAPSYQQRNPRTWDEELEELEDELSDDDDDDELSLVEDASKDMAIRDWIRSQLLRGDWRDPVDVWTDAGVILRQQLFSLPKEDRKIVVDTHRVIVRHDQEVLRDDAELEWDADGTGRMEELVDGLEDGDGWDEESDKTVPYELTPEELASASYIKVKRPCWWAVASSSTPAGSDAVPAPSSETLSLDGDEFEDEDMDEDMKLAIQLSKEEGMVPAPPRRASAPSPPSSRHNAVHPRRFATNGESEEDDGSIIDILLPPPTSNLWPSTHTLSQALSHLYPMMLRELLGGPMNRLVRALESIASKYNEIGGKGAVDAGALAKKLTAENVVAFLREMDGLWFEDLLDDLSVLQEVEGRLRDLHVLPQRAVNGDDPIMGPESGAGAGSKLARVIPWIPCDVGILGGRCLQAIAYVWRAACAPLYHCKCSICERARRMEREAEGAKVGNRPIQQITPQQSQAEEDYEESLRERFGVMDQRPPPPPPANPLPQTNPYPPQPQVQKYGTIVIPPRVRQNGVGLASPPQTPPPRKRSHDECEPPIPAEQEAAEVKKMRSEDHIQAKGNMELVDDTVPSSPEKRRSEELALEPEEDPESERGKRVRVE